MEPQLSRPHDVILGSPVEVPVASRRKPQILLEPTHSRVKLIILPRVTTADNTKIDPHN